MSSSALASLARAALVSATLVLPALVAPAATVLLTGDGMTANEPAKFLDPAQWADGALPKEGDDIIAKDVYIHDGPASVLRVRSLLHERHARGFFVRTSVVVSGDVLLQDTLEFQRETATLSVGDFIEVERNELSLVGGLAEEKKGQFAPRVTAKSLSVQAEGRLRLRWFKNVPEGLPGNSVPYFRVSGDATFAPGAGVRIKFETPDAGADLFPGEYLLLTAAAIKGPLPKLELVDLPADSRSKGELKLSPDKRRLLLVVSAGK